jgi:hypothetical protein
VREREREREREGERERGRNCIGRFRQLLRRTVRVGNPDWGFPADLAYGLLVCGSVEG